MTRKTFVYKVYDSSGNLKKTWIDVRSGVAFSSVMNEGLSDFPVEIARDSSNFGEDEDVKYNNQLKVYSCDDASGLTGCTLIYSGRLTQYLPSIQGREQTLKCTFLSYWQQAQQIIVEDDGNNYTLTPAPIFKDQVTPEMSANNTPSVYTVSASTEVSGYSAYLALDRSESTEWRANATTGYLKIDFGVFLSPKARKYIITAPSDATKAPKTFTLQGSATGAFSGEETTLDTQTNLTSWTANERKEFEFANTTAFRYYRVNITANNGHASNVGIANLELYEAEARTGATSIRYKGEDPSEILKDLLDRFTQSSVGGKLDYATGSIDATGISVDYVFSNVTYQEAFKKVIDMCPFGWFIRTGADDIVYLKAKSSTADHIFTLGKDILGFEPEKRIENVINTLYFFGGDDGTGKKLFKKYTRSGSVSSYGVYAQRVSDESVHDIGTMDDIAGRILDNLDSPEIRVVLKILDDNNDQGKGYDIDTIKVGDTCRIVNATAQSENLWDSTIWDTSKWDFDINNAAAILLQIQKVETHEDYVILELSNRQPDIARRIEEIAQKLVQQQVKGAGIIPET